MNGNWQEDLFAAQEYLLLEPVASGRFRILGKPPRWLGVADAGDRLSAFEIDAVDRFPFLQAFLPEAQSVWNNSEMMSAQSSWWTDTDSAGIEIHLIAEAQVIGGCPLLIIRRNERDYQERQQLLQKARELALDHEQWIKEKNEKEVLLHCLVHDLSGPLSGMLGCLELLSTESLSEMGRNMLVLGQVEAHKQKNLIHDLLDIYRAEIRQWGTVPSDLDCAPDMRIAAESALAGLRASFLSKHIETTLHINSPETNDWRVIADPSKLDRVLYNLLQNALRHVPKNGQVRVILQSSEVHITTFVDDNGHGVDPAFIPRLFQKMIQGEGVIGKAGLGLFFCRIAVEQFGGTIGYEPSPMGGARFWFRLRKPEILPSPSVVSPK